MATLYIPYCNDKPVSIEVNGHTLLILCPDEDILLFNDVLDAEYALPLDDDHIANESDLEAKLGTLAHNEGAGVVIAPAEVPLEELVENLRDQLPWIQ